MALNPQFTVNFNARSGDYRGFIQDLRKRLAVSGRFTHNRPILPQQQNPPTRWFHVVLRTANHSVTLVFRGDNVYLRGFRSAAGVWWEFGNQQAGAARLIPGSTFLGFDDRYRSLVGDTDNLMRVQLGRNQMADAADALATRVAADASSGPQQQKAKNSLVALVLMISEAARFITVSTTVENLMQRQGSPHGTITAQVKDQVVGWSDISEALLKWDRNPTLTFPNLKKMGINNAVQAAAVVALVLFVVLRMANVVVNRPTFALLDAVDGDVEGDIEQHAAQGRPLAEVLAVRVLDVNGEGDSDSRLFGAITVVDGLRAQYIYNRNEGDSLVVHSQDIIMLTGPAQAISAYGNFVIDVDLKVSKTNLPSSEISKGQISWDGFDTDTDYDKVLSKVVTGQSGSAEVRYAVLSDAVEAMVEVTLTHGEGAQSGNVYGTVTARNGLLATKIDLFKNAPDDNIIITPRQPIPLLRSTVAAPLNSSLAIEADLHSSSGDEVVKGTVEFPVELDGEQVLSIAGNNSQLDVKITWLNFS